MPYQYENLHYKDKTTDSLIFIMRIATDGKIAFQLL